MKTRRRPILLALLILPASAIQGCGCGHNQVVVQNRQGTPVQVETEDGVRVQAPFVDVRVPSKKGMTAGRVDVPMVEPD